MGAPPSLPLLCGPWVLDAVLPSLVLWVLFGLLALLSAWPSLGLRFSLSVALRRPWLPAPAPRLALASLPSRGPLGPLLVLWSPFRPGPPWVIGSLSSALRRPCVPAPVPRSWFNQLLYAVPWKSTSPSGNARYSERDIEKSILVYASSVRMISFRVPRSWFNHLMYAVPWKSTSPSGTVRYSERDIEKSILVCASYVRMLSFRNDISKSITQCIIVTALVVY